MLDTLVNYNSTDISITMQAVYIIPLLTAITYSLSTLCLKSSSNAGVGPWRTTFFINIVCGLMAALFWIPIGFSFTMAEFWASLIMAVGFFLGQLFTSLGIHRGDLSVFTPIMGLKVIFVALLSIFLLDSVARPLVWLGAILSILAIFLMRGSAKAERKRLMPSVVLGIVSALFFALTDVLVQLYGQQIRYERLIALMFGLLGFMSVTLIPMFKSPLSDITLSSWKWLIGGSVLYSAQTIGMAYVLAEYGEATIVNIIYSSRGIFSVVLVWLIGHWFANQEKSQGAGVMMRRILGAILMTVAIILALS